MRKHKNLGTILDMSTHPLLHILNEKQQEVVSAPQTHLLVLAGAGSGKTRVLVHRIAWLIQEENISPHSILAVTFTNKAAGEMRGRLESLMKQSIQSMWVGTFHSLTHRMLRQHWKEAGLTQNFQILDADDQLRLLKRVIQNLNLDDTQWIPKKVQGFINKQKDEGLSPSKISNNQDPYTKTLVRIYVAYEQLCQQNGVIDFADLLLDCYELLHNNPEILAYYRMRFTHILVDEFQDTNTIQYLWLKLLVGPSNYLTIVGDDDQSIYGWRGARIENIQRVTRDFTNTLTIRLEQNYRSTQVILTAANTLIANNSERLGKNLWTSGDRGELISVYAAFNDLDEARFITDQIKQFLKKGIQPQEIGLLYRSNAQSRLLEEGLIQAGIPYRIYGGLRFFERAEIKDALAYMRLISNRDADSAFERAVNTPARGIGSQTLNLLRTESVQRGISLWQTSLQLIAEKILTPRGASALTIFLRLIDQLDATTKEFVLGEQTEHILYGSGLFSFYEKEKSEKGQARAENLEELINAARQFSPESWEISPLHSFLAHTALEAGDYQGDSFQNCVQLMTLHAAKGLEFPLVFLCGMEEGLFPHHMSINEPGRLEEERRLCYVGITRAMQKLFITYAEIRRLHGTESYHRSSRFLGEIPAELIDEVRFKSHVSRPTVSTRAFSSPFPEQNMHDGFWIGQHVNHQVFGDGVILSLEGQGAHMRVQVKFKQFGNKWLVASFAKLTPT